ncbi:PolyADP-ribose polymerase [Senna tora]|uniref:PolyADP-ribose polymerase n=1 Tax=Senna tora TaxID=362788 RepID=A0A834TXA5_9FABA|nr:PolyADP-ribose polymerase [Senna tora]
MSKPRTHRKPSKNAIANHNEKPQKQPSWAVLHEERVLPEDQNGKKCKKMKSCSGSLCNNTKIMARPETGCPDVHKKRVSLGACSSTNNEASSRSMKAPSHEPNGAVSASSSSLSVSSNSSASGTSFRGMPFRRLSGCYECRMVVDPVLGFTRDPSLRGSICSCPDCGEIFTKAESLELHQAVKHAVSELGAEDTSKNIVEIIFHSSWLKKQSPVCKIERILKVHNTQKTISRFEEYRECIKAKATKKHPRCIADGNELLRFHCTTLVCSLGLNGSSNLCNSIPQCNVCNIIKNGLKLKVGGKGILTTATSGKAHDKAEVEEGDENRAMLVCRVIAGRVKKNVEGSNSMGMEEYDSVGGSVGAYSNLDELYVFNPRAILPCFVVIYRGF